MKEHKIYLLKTHLKTENGEYLYKIGRSEQQGLKRLIDYPKTYQLIIMRTCIDCVYIERELIKLFTKKYKKEFKNEYFVGNENEMINDINKMINDELEAHNLTKELIIIKSKINENGKKIYYITDQKHNILRELINIGHIKWILSGDYYDLDDNCIDIKENTLYDINDGMFINSIKIYTNILGEAKNIYEDKTNALLKSKYKNELALKNDEFSKLSIKGKIVYLFEVDTIIDNLDGRYITFENKLYLFSQAPQDIFEISTQVNSNDLLENHNNFLIKDDLLIHYFRMFGTIKKLKNPLHFNIL